MQAQRAEPSRAKPSQARPAWAPAPHLGLPHTPADADADAAAAAPSAFPARAPPERAPSQLRRLAARATRLRQQQPVELPGPALPATKMAAPALAAPRSWRRGKGLARHQDGGPRGRRCRSFKSLAEHRGGGRQEVDRRPGEPLGNHSLESAPQRGITRDGSLRRTVRVVFTFLLTPEADFPPIFLYPRRSRGGGKRWSPPDWIPRRAVTGRDFTRHFMCVCVCC